MDNKVIRNYSKEEGIYISDFDNYMQGNPFVKKIEEWSELIKLIK